MSRTYKDRPYWVLKNDPTMDRYARHDHIVVLREKIGEEPVTRKVPSKDGWHWEEEVWYTRPIFKTWTEQVPCTLDIPEEPMSVWRKHSRTKTNEDRLAEKNCFWWLEYYPNIKSDKDFKRLTNGAVRSKVRQQLNKAVRDRNSDWEDLDVFVDSKHLSRGWWDW